MAKFMFVVPPFFGHINPTLSLGAALLSKGHEVVWVGIRDLSSEHIPEGGQFMVPYKELGPHEAELDEILEKQGQGASLSGLEAIKLSLEETYIPFCRLMMPGLARLVNEWQPDVIIHDEIMFAGALCAYQQNIPYVTLMTAPPKAFNHSDGAIKKPKIDEWAINLTLDLQREFGVTTERFVLRSESLCLVTTSREFADASDLPDYYQFVGPLIKDRPGHIEFDWERLDQTTLPKVYVSVGTVLVDIRKQFFTKLIEAFANEPILMVVSTDPDILPEWPDNFMVQSYVPQLELLPRVDAVITHAGFNTVNETLAQGLPMLAIPMAYDQFYNASLIEKSGSGVAIRYKRLHVPAMQRALDKILNDDTYKQAALAMQDALQACGGVAQAAEYIENCYKDSLSGTSILQ